MTGWEPPESRPETDVATRPLHVVGLGASAGGLEALERFFRATPGDTGAAFVAIMHLSPDFKSMMPDLLGQYTSMPVVPVGGRMPLEPDTVYVLIAGSQLELDPERLELVPTPRSDPTGINASVNTFFRSLARLGEQASVVVLSGTGTDGSLGAGDVHAHGGLVIAQAPESARFDGMPRKVIESGHADCVLSPEEMPQALAEFIRDPAVGRAFQQAADHGLDGDPPGYGPILRRLNSAYGIDFSNYKPGTIARRIERRLRQTGHLEAIGSYADLLREEHDELERLYRDLLIGVTRFFRDRRTFRELATRAVAPLVDRLAANEELRVWVCGCSTGEEAYSIGMLALEAFEERGLTPRIRILATDLHPRSLQSASAGVYPAKSVHEVPANLRAKYFTSTGDDAYRVRNDLRRLVIFAQHNLITDAGFTRMHMVACRNLLIYLRSQAQARALATLHSALSVGGILLLGKSEGPGALVAALDTLDHEHSIYRKTHEIRMPDAVRSLVLPHGKRTARPLTREGRGGSRVYEHLLETYMPAGLLLSPDHELLHVFGNGGRFLAPISGRFRDNIASLLPGTLHTAVLVALRGAAQKGTTVSFGDIELTDERGAITVRVSVDPVMDPRGGPPHFLVRLEQQAETEAAAPASPRPRLPEESELVGEMEHELETLRERLRHTVEELESSNQELQAGNEELIASNEELQSTNEELHAVNEELNTINAEHELKIRELNAVSADLHNLIRSTGLATLFLDTEMRVRLFTPEAQQVFRLLPRDVGRDLRDLTLRETDPELPSDLEHAAAVPQTIERELEWSGGHHCLRRLTPYRDSENRPAGLVLTYVDITEQTRLRNALLDQEQRFRATVESAPMAMVMIDEAGTIQLVNAETERLFGYDRDELLGKKIETLVPARFHDQHPGLRAEFCRAPAARRMGEGRDLYGRRQDETEFPVEIGLNPLHTNEGLFVVCAIIDITERKRLHDRQRAIIQSAPTAMVMVDANGNIVLCNAELERVFGYDLGELIGRPIAVLIPEAVRAQHAVKRAHYFARPEARAMGAGRDLAGLRKDGSEFPVEVGLSPVRTDDRTFVIAAVVDLSARKAAEEKLRHANEALTRSNLAQQQFIYIVSHDLREPINTISNFAGLLAEEASATLGEDGSRYLDHVRQGAERIRTLLNDLLGYVRLDRSEIELEPVVLDHVLDDVRKDIDTALSQRDATLECPPMPDVLGQVSMLRVLLQNLIDNATKFSRPGVAPRVEISWQRRDEEVEIVVADNGIGIDPAHHERAFELFRRLHPQRKHPGTGIGLAMCKKIVELHQGRIWLESEVDVGTRVHVVLRLAAVPERKP